MRRVSASIPYRCLPTRHARAASGTIRKGTDPLPTPPASRIPWTKVALMA
ncbi:MAG: hypothetical protein OXC07_01525 [Kistimonas sp.]|nr:hypothetical protein [Kistimonas sp.]